MKKISKFWSHSTRYNLHSLVVVCVVAPLWFFANNYVFYRAVAGGAVVLVAYLVGVLFVLPAGFGWLMHRSVVTSAFAWMMQRCGWKRVDLPLMLSIQSHEHQEAYNARFALGVATVAWLEARSPLRVTAVDKTLLMRSDADMVDFRLQLSDEIAAAQAEAYAINWFLTSPRDVVLASLKSQLPPHP